MNTTNAKKLGAAIRRHREAAGLHRKQLAERCGVETSTISRLEAGEFREPRPEKLQRIARALEIDFEDLFALAGYAPAGSLPGLPIFLRQKVGLSKTEAERVERYVERIKGQKGRRS